MVDFSDSGMRNLTSTGGSHPSPSLQLLSRRARSGILITNRRPSSPPIEENKVSKDDSGLKLPTSHMDDSAKKRVFRSTDLPPRKKSDSGIESKAGKQKISPNKETKDSLPNKIVSFSSDDEGKLSKLSSLVKTREKSGVLNDELEVPMSASGGGFSSEEEALKRTRDTHVSLTPTLISDVSSDDGLSSREGSRDSTASSSRIKALAGKPLTSDGSPHLEVKHHSSRSSKVLAGKSSHYEPLTVTEPHMERAQSRSQRTPRESEVATLEPRKSRAGKSPQGSTSLPGKTSSEDFPPVSDSPKLPRSSRSSKTSKPSSEIENTSSSPTLDSPKLPRSSGSSRATKVPDESERASASSNFDFPKPRRLSRSIRVPTDIRSSTTATAPPEEVAAAVDELENLYGDESSFSEKTSSKAKKPSS